MKYLVNRETKEHKAAPEDGMLYDHLISNGWRAVQADSEGWIKHDGGECPLPDGHLCDARDVDGFEWANVRALDDYAVGPIEWIHATPHMSSRIAFYRPILDDKQRPTANDYLSAADSILKGKRKQTYNAQGERNQPDNSGIIDRLLASHKAASELPDIIAELREVLEPMGYDLVARDPFVEPEPEPDTKAWINWRKGDVLECVDSAIGITVGNLYVVLGMDMGHPDIAEDDQGRTNSYYRHHFRFHSRPTKEQDK